jgi:hypothetical protein
MATRGVAILLVAAPLEPGGSGSGDRDDVDVKTMAGRHANLWMMQANLNRMEAICMQSLMATGGQL